MQWRRRMDDPRQGAWKEKDGTTTDPSDRDWMWDRLYALPRPIR